MNFMTENLADNVVALTPPSPVAEIEPDKASQMILLADDVMHKLDEQVRQFVEDTVDMDKDGTVFKQRLASIHHLGNADIRKSAALSNRMLEKPVKVLSNGLFNETSTIGKNLLELRCTVDALNPARQGNLFKPRKLLGFIPFGNKIEAYFKQYASAQDHLNSILEGLADSKDELLRDNVAIEMEKVELWNTMQGIEQCIYMGKKLDEKLTGQIAEIEAKDVEKARIIKEELLFYTRQKVIDLQTQQAVSIQGYLVLDLIRKNNLELIKGVERASTTTISALRTAVMTAQALGNQSLVLKQIKSLNTTTENIIVTTSAMLKSQSAGIQQQASNSMIGVNKLQQAFDNIFVSMDMISDYKSKALENMQQTVDGLSAQINRAEKYLQQVKENDEKTANQYSGIDTK